MNYTPEQAIDMIYQMFGDIPNAAKTGQKKFTLVEPTGKNEIILDTMFLPTTGPNDGLFISKFKPVSKTKFGQVEKSLSYTKISHLENVSKPGGVDKLFKTHIYPPGKEKVGIAEVSGMLYHFPYKKEAEAIEDHILSRPKYDIEAPKGIIVMCMEKAGINFDERFSKPKVVEEAIYDGKIIDTITNMIEDDVSKIPTYSM